jgi:signal transduction histidine kinase
MTEDEFSGIVKNHSLEDPMRFRSLRWQLSLTYAGIALLTALVLNLLLLGALQAYYQGQEQAYLVNNATFITQNLVRLIEAGVPEEALAAQLKALSFLSQTRLRLMDARQGVVADSGPPALVQLEIVVSPKTAGLQEFLPGDQAGTDGGGDESQYGAYLAFRPLAPIAAPASAEHSPDEPVEPDEPSEPLPPDEIAAPLPAGETGIIVLPPDPSRRNRAEMILARSGVPTLNSWFGRGLGSDVSRLSVSSEAGIFPLSAVDSDGKMRLLGYVELSEGPAFGREVLRNVARLGGLTGLVAILLAAGAGWLVSRRLSRPVMALTAATTRVAEGDLRARADVRQADELGRLATAFNHMAERLEGLVNTLRRFVADAAHELNTPLAILHTDLELLIASGLEPRQRQLADRILIQAQRLEALVGGLLDLSRLESASEALSSVPLDLAALAQLIAERYAAQAEQGGLAFELDIQSDSPLFIQGNSEQITRAVGNLLDNAIKFTPAEGRVRLAVGQANGWAELSVEDTGISIPAEDLPALFQRFHRGRNTSAYPGSGLGLAIVKRIVERHSGRVAAESSGEGARFRVWLPLSRRL